MEIVGTATKVNIYIGDSDRWRGRPLYSALLEMLKAEGCAGATVTRAIAGFGAHSRIHSASIMRLSEDLPLVIEWVDHPDRVGRIMPRVVEMVAEGLITVQPVEVVTYTHRKLRELPAAAPVSDVMATEVRAVQTDTPVAEIVALLIARDYRALPVLDSSGRVVGILTDGDLVSRAGIMTTSLEQALTGSELSQHLSALKASGQTAVDLMTPDPVTVQTNTPIGDAVKAMTQRDVKRLPVLDAAGRLAGMVSRTDVLRALALPPVQAAPHRTEQPGSRAVVSDVMTHNVPVVTVDASLGDVVNLLVTTSQRRVVVVDESDQIAGIITDSDILQRSADNDRSGILTAFSQRLPLVGRDQIGLGKRTAADVMTRNPITVAPDTPLLEALQRLLQGKIKRLPVVDNAGHVVGLIGRGQILQALSSEV